MFKGRGLRELAKRVERKAERGWKGELLYGRWVKEQASDREVKSLWLRVLRGGADWVREVVRFIGSEGSNLVPNCAYGE